MTQKIAYSCAKYIYRQVGIGKVDEMIFLGNSVSAHATLYQMYLFLLNLLIV